MDLGLPENDGNDSDHLHMELHRILDVDEMPNMPELDVPTEDRNRDDSDDGSSLGL